MATVDQQDCRFCGEPGPHPFDVLTTGKHYAEGRSDPREHLDSVHGVPFVGGVGSAVHKGHRRLRRQAHGMDARR